jgi:predicted MFS family arabinose efflux permease
MTRDRRLIYAAAFLRSVAVGAVGVFAAIDLGARGFSIAAIGIVVGAGMAGGALTTLLVGARADVRVGRRRLLMLLAALGAFGYVAMTRSMPLALLIACAFLGTVNAMGRDRGGVSALEQAMLPDTVPTERRTWALAWYNLVLDVGHAVGALAGATPALLASAWRIDSDTAHRATFGLCALALGAGVILYAQLSPSLEAVTGGATASPPPISDDTRHRVRNLAALFFLDSLGGGFLGSALVAYWFFERYGLSEQQIAALFFAARGLNALSHLGAAWLAGRIGLLNTMVFTHLPSSLFLMAAPAAPAPGLAAGLFLAREGLVEMDVPTRQSYVLAIVRPEERTYASGITNLMRNLGWAAGPFIAGAVMQHVALAGPLLIGGSLKIVYDVLLYRSFRKIKPPEEGPQSGPRPMAQGSRG